MQLPLMHSPPLPHAWSFGFLPHIMPMQKFPAVHWFVIVQLVKQTKPLPLPLHW